MKFKTRIAISPHPDLDFKTHLQQLDFSIFGRAAMRFATGEIKVDLQTIPLQITIPFLHRRVVAGHIGPFKLHVQPMEIAAEAGELGLEGKLGGEAGINGHLHVDGRCNAEIEATGDFAAKLLKAAVEGVFEE
jgi:hypothetical protein